jgi:hypothetical protein
VIVDDDRQLIHYGILRKSGRYPWGSGATQSARNKTFLSTVENLRKEGLSDVEIAKGFSTDEHPFTTTMLRAATSIARNEQKQAQINQAQRLKDKGWSNVKIGERMGLNESSVRSLLAPGAKDKADVLQATTKMLEDQVTKKTYVDVGSGVENYIGVSSTRLGVALAMMQEKGYQVHTVKIPQVGTGEMTTIKVLTKPGISQRDVWMNRHSIQQIAEYSDDGGRSFLGVKDPLNISSKRVHVRYAEQGGTDADGVIYVRPGVPDVSIGKARYAQVRIAVDGSHYLKGMAVYKDDLPDGVDLMFNTNKSDTGNKLDALKPLKEDKDNPFGATIRQIHDNDGNVISAMNIVGSPTKEGSGEEGSWDTWSRNLPAQMLSKQSPDLAKAQLQVTYERRLREYAEINALTNPNVKKKLLQSFADETDSASVHLKAASIPRQATKVLLPVASMKPTEVYAPSFRDGERVALVRFPHGGTFEIPQLTVNNRNREAVSLLGKSAEDAVGIHPKVAERLSGADFDGDTVLVIPNSKGQIKSTPPLEGLKGFDPKRSYPKYEGMIPIDAVKGRDQTEMGLITNLITDMTIRGAGPDDLARAVRHSMVVIDAKKHELDYRQSAVDNGISQLKQKYQGSAKSGASTLISRATSEQRVPDRRLRRASEGGAIDPTTGRKVYVETGRTYVNKAGKVTPKTQRSTKLGETDDAYTLVSKGSGTRIEQVYADHSNRLKSLANQARKEMVATPNSKVNPSAKTPYSNEVASLNAKLNIAVKNRPLERQAQVLANQVVSLKRQAEPGMESADVKKIKSQALTEARARTGAGKQRIVITPDEWKAIQAGAISSSKLDQILTHADMDVVKTLATPKSKLLMTPTAKARAAQMKLQGYTQAEIADQLGVSLTTLKTNVDS